MKFLDYVNVRMGTDTTPLFSNGNTLPMTSVPFGMNNFLVETRGHNPLEIFNATDRVTTGIRLTHCSNRWLGDYGFLTEAKAPNPEYAAQVPLCPKRPL